MADVYNEIKNIPDSEKFPPKGYNTDNYPRVAYGSVTSAELKALNTTVKVAITGREGMYVIVESAFCFLDHGGTDYAASGGISFRYTDGSGDAVLNVLPEVAFVEASADVVMMLHGIDCVPVAGANVVISADSADPTAGDGVLYYKIVYRYESF